MERRKVHPRVRQSLRDLLVKYQARGVDVFVFGSLARSWPESVRGADLDLGYDSRQLVESADEVIAELERDVSSLPTIRPVDLVDFATVSDSFRAEALRHVRREL